MVSGRTASEELVDVLDQRRLRVAPCVSDIDDERNPAVVSDSLKESETGVS